MKCTRFRDVPKYIMNGSYEIDVTPDRLIVNIDEFVKVDGLQLDPDFQRGHVWNEKQQIAFIEFFLRGGKTGRVIYLNYPSWHRQRLENEYNDFVIVDGKQRYEAWRRFIGNEIKAFGSYYREYTDNIHMINTMKLNVNDLKTKVEVLQWYCDFNAGGVVHTDAEIAKVKNLIRKEKRGAK